MSMDNTEIAIGITGLVATMAAWRFGGRQRAKNENTDAITKGTDQIVETSSKLLAKLDQMLDEEREHRIACETSLGEHKELIVNLTKKVAELEKRI